MPSEFLPNSSAFSASAVRNSAQTKGILAAALRGFGRRSRLFDGLSMQRSVCLAVCLLVSGVGLGGNVPILLAADEQPAAAEQWQALQAEVEELASKLDERQTRQRLIAIDDELTGELSAEVAKLRGRILRLLATTEDSDSLLYIRGVFESDTEFRDEAAHALSLAAYQSPSDLQDWRFLIRSLTMVEGEQAVAVMRALTRFRQRATNSHWIRRVILHGLKLPEDQQQVALDLLGHWTGRKVSDPEAHNQSTVVDYQAWFEQKWPDEPPAAWPAEPADARWTQARLRELIETAQFTPEQVEQGREVFVKANCSKCHVKGKLGLPLGPELSDITAMRQRRELIEAILFPSLEIHEDYQTVSVVTRDGKIFTGLPTTDEQGRLSVVNHEGKAHPVPREEIEEMLPQKTSNMPAGGLEPLSQAEILALFAFLDYRENPNKKYHTLE